jgi:arabinofuranan 3-O-arabinosyltransferase
MTTAATAVFDRIKRYRASFQVALLVALAYLPTLTAMPGKMPSDTKLYLYFDPTRLTADALSTWDSRQFAGWVPHQTLSYLWPSGPWYSAFSGLGVPDWVAHRLWLGTLFVCGGLGVRWAAKHLGLSATGGLIAALFYQLSPYVLPYVSRTSAMLLPWAGLGWLIGLTIRAATRTRWRDVAIFGLVILTVAAPNATAILMIAPAPVLWLLHAGWSRIITWKRAAITAAKIGGISALMSLWWIAMLSVQGKFGADVLGYSESLQAVSLTASSPEVLRGMGYWLFYVRDPIGFATTASFDYMTSGRLIAISFAVLAIGLIGIVGTKWVARRYAALLVLVGVVLAVGVHPIEDPPPLFSGFADNSRSSISLALRSSTRAMPLSTLGIALGAGALVTAIGRANLRSRMKAPQLLVPWIAGLLAILNLPVLFNGGMVDPNLVRDEDPPAAWTDAAAALDAQPNGYRVFELPGEEFGAFRWGYTVDPPLPGLTDKPLVTRDLLPLGSAGAMDLIYALDNRFQEGIAEPAEVVPIARLLGVDTVWLPNDVAFERFRTPRPEITRQFFQDAAGADGLGPPTAFGEPAENAPVLPMVDEQSISSSVVGAPMPPVELLPVEDPVPIMRTKTDAVVVAGSGDGVVDAAAAGLLSGDELIEYAADLQTPDGRGTLGDATHVILTDSNRDRAYQWRSAQDVKGFTEDGSGTGVLRFDPADQRTPVFQDPTSDDMTIAEQRGPVRASASAYGAPSAYLPEHRAAMAVDGDPATAWVVGDRYDANGEFLRLDSDAPIDQLTLLQPQDRRNRWITGVDITDDGGTYPVDLDDSSRSGNGQVIPIRTASSRVTITIRATAHEALRLGEGLDAVGFAEVHASDRATEEIVRVPSNVTASVSPNARLDVVLTRERTRETNRWRSDPETHLVRSFTLPAERTFDPAVTARLNLRAPDTTIAALIGWTGTTANRRLTGVPAMGGWAATDGDPATAWASPFGEAIGSELTIPLAGATTLTSLQIRQPVSDQFGLITALTVTTSSGSQSVEVPTPDENGLSTVTFPALTGDTLRITVDATNDATTTDRRYAEQVRLPVGISEINGDGIVPAALPAHLDTPCDATALSIDGRSVGVQLSATIADLFAGRPATTLPCGSASLALGPGEHIVRSTPGAASGIDIDRVVLSSAGAAPPAPSPAVAATVTDNGKTDRTVRVDACPQGCWFVFGEGYSTGWTASLDGHSLGAPSQVDGGFNGWYLPPSETTRTIHLTFTGQRTLWIGLALTTLGLVLCIALIVLDRRRIAVDDPDRPVLASPWDRRPWAATTLWRSPALLATAATLVVGVLVIDPLWGILCAAITAVGCFVVRRPRLVGWVAVLIALYIGAVMVRRVTSLHPFANAGWPGQFEDLHHLGLTVVVLLVGSAIATPRPPRRSRADGAP